MPRLTRQIETRLAIEPAFAFVADFANAMHWDPGVATSEALDAGPIGQGSRFRLGVRLGRRVAPMEYRITTFAPSHRVVLAGEDPGVRAVDAIVFTPLGTGTRIGYTADIALGGLMRFLQPFLGRAFASLADNAVGGMRRALDAQADAAATTEPATPVEAGHADPVVLADAPVVGA